MMTLSAPLHMSTSLPLCSRTTTDMRLRVLVKGMVQRMVKRVGGGPSEEAPSEEEEGLEACSGLVGNMTDAPPGSRPGQVQERVLVRGSLRWKGSELR